MNLRCQDVGEYGRLRVRVSCFQPATHELLFRSPWGPFTLDVCRRHALASLLVGHTNDPYMFMFGPLRSVLGIPILTIGGEP